MAVVLTAALLFGALGESQQHSHTTQRVESTRWRSARGTNTPVSCGDEVFRTWRASKPCKEKARSPFKLILPNFSLFRRDREQPPQLVAAVAAFYGADIAFGWVTLINSRLSPRSSHSLAKRGRPSVLLFSNDSTTATLRTRSCRQRRRPPLRVKIRWRKTLC